MKKIILAIIIFLCVFIYAFWDYPFFIPKDIQVRDIGDTQEIIMRNFPDVGVKTDVLIYEWNDEELIALTYDISKVPREHQKFRQDACEIHTINRRNGNKQIFRTLDEFKKKYHRDMELRREFISEFKRLEC